MSGGQSLVRSSLFAAVAAACCALPIFAFAAPAAAGPYALRDYLRACGISEDDFARFRDDRQMAGEELEVAGRIARRLGDCPADSLRKLIAQEAAAQLDGPKQDQRGRPLRLQGRVESIEQATETLVRCTVANETRPHRAVVYWVGQTAHLPRAGDRIAADAVFVKCVPDVQDQPLPVFVAPRLQRRAAGPLGDLDFDAELFRGIGDNASMTAADSAAFWRLLALTKMADADRLDGKATPLDAAAAARLFADPAGQRGRLFRVFGIARRAVRVAIDDQAAAARLGADHYFEIDVISDALQNNPLTICTLELPTGQPPGDGPDVRRALETLAGGTASGERGTVPSSATVVYLRQPVEVTGFFLKNWQYPTGMTAAERAEYPGVSRLMQTAPLLVGPPPRWEPAFAAKNHLPDWAIGGIVALAITGLGLLLWHLRQSDGEFSTRSQL